MLERFAAIDIGTNTLLMLIAEVVDSKIIRIVSDKHHIARLGENLEATGDIQKPAILRANKILRDYAELCKIHNVSKIKIAATSALRDANNKDFVLAEFRKYLDVDVEIISGDEEARLSFLGTVDDNSISMLIDIGGGSTEFIIGQNENIIARKSLQIGAVRLTERFFASHPPTAEQFNLFNQFITAELNNILSPFDGSKLYAVAGTPTTIASILLGLKEFDQNKLNNYILNIDDIQNVLNIFLNNDLNFLVNNLNIHPLRADIITAGTAILLESLKALERNSCLVSSKGLRFGILKSMLNKN